MQLEHLQGIGLELVAAPACTIGFRREPCSGADAVRAVSEAGEGSDAVRAVSGGQDNEHDAPPPAFLDLPDVVETIGETSCEPELLARLGMTSRQMWAHVGGLDFALRRAEELRRHGASWAEGCAKLELLALGLQVQRSCSGPTKNHVYFPYGGGTDLMEPTIHLINEAAAVGKRFPRVRLHVDAHTGRAAPGGIARACSVHRARVVKRALRLRGVAERRLSSSAWGKQVAQHWSEPDGETAARAEVFFCMDGCEFPPRSAHYSLVANQPSPELGLGLDLEEDRDWGWGL
ncbi:unnamed protein product [Prorocentrum cordatum]|uniref:Uncharacterized protein n=1 Tax=Prorocentrum cordatum TaxID=2364126 RepID=A0ABN9XAD2_9DINO|nr:unnamed protein product [Polarella glacialis]